MSSTQRTAAAATVLAGLLACSPSTGASAPATAGLAAESSGEPHAEHAGAAGIGDADFPLDGNGGYDVAHYGLRLDYDPRGKRLTGVTAVAAKATQPLTRFNLDLHGFEVGAVSVDGRQAAFSRSGDELTVTPGRPLAKGAKFVVKVAYSGRPEAIKDAANLGTYGWITTSDGAFVTCEPNGAKTWFPANDHPSDKARFDFEITVPAGLTALANGELVGKPRTSRGKTTFVWRERHPMATYLATATLGEFELREGRTPGGIDNLAAVDPAFRSSLGRVYSLSGQITDYWAGIFGPYPFSSTGGVVDDFATGYALENQTKPMYGGFDPDESIIAHELAHQWFGNSLSVRRWRDLWLNEGFATYAEWLWAEHRGRGKAQETFDTQLARAATDPIWAYPPGRAKPDDLFNESVYTRGAMTLHALREKIGDTDFFRLLKDWNTEHRYGHVTTAQFIAMAEKVSGKRLGSLFDAWLFTPRRPPADNR
ncbi:M1 family metallopeptidase [Nonomuraea longicatena]|uniref:Aminopeptidase N n=1 Tax=Nonomuraea longicatena TaxID=83682 RepID=A0ABN1QZ35_9ACTN